MFKKIVKLLTEVSFSTKMDKASKKKDVWRWLILLEI